MALARRTRRLVVCLVLCALASATAATPREARDTTTLARELAAARDAERIPLLLELAGLRRHEGPAVLQLTDEALTLLRSHPSAAREVEARVARSGALEGLGDYPAARTEAERAESLAHRLDDPKLLASASHQLAFVRWRMNDYAGALSMAESARRLLTSLGDSTALVPTLSLVGAIHHSRGDLGAGLEGYLAALRMGEALGDEVATARAHNNIGLLYWDLGRNEDAHAALRRALAIHERLGPRANLANTLNNLGLVLIELQRPREALPHLERALAMDREDGNLYGQAKVLSNLGWAHEQHQPARAVEFHRQALALRQRIGDKEGVVRSLGALAEHELRGGDTRGAIATWERSIAIAAAIQDRIDEAEQLESLSKARASIGDTEGALAAFRRFHELQAALSDSAARRHAAELEARYRARERERDLAAIEAVAESRRVEIRRWIVWSGMLGATLLALGVLYLLRLRGQRALAESEQRYRALFQASVVPTFLIEAESRRILDLNAPARALCGDAPAADRRRIDEVEPEWIRRALGSLFNQDFGESVARDDLWCDANGRVRWTEIRGSTVALGGRACRLASVRDTTELRAQEETRQREEKMQSLGVLAGGIAHDFNNALAAIIGHVALAKEQGTDESREMLDHAEQAAVQASRLTTQLLAFARGGQPVRRSSNVGRLLRDTVGFASAGSRMQVRLEVPDDLWPAHLDGGQFSQVVSNLVINARQATGEGGHLRVSASNVDGSTVPGQRLADQRYVRIDFADDGPGIPESVRARVFEPYFTTRDDGRGLGLTTAYAICRNHGGALAVESREGEGTTFSAFFPAASGAAMEDEHEPVGRPEGVGRILVLDDDPLVRNVLQKLLELWGYTVEAVADGRSAVELFVRRSREGRRFDLLILDLTIPGGMGGRQALAEILAHDPHARAIVASGYSDDPVMANHREAGFVAALAKPFQRGELARVVQSVLREAVGSE